MYKTFSPGSWDFGIEPVVLVKQSSRGIIGGDYNLLVKRAGEEFAHLARQVELGPGEFPIHLIAMGATEAYGPNRNGDGFKAAALRKHVDTFKKFAKHYRHHKNRDPKKSYGVIKLAYYNEAMRRAELLVALNETKEAAERNDGFVADRELELLNSGKDLPVSMACKVAYDVCSACGNKAPSRRQYCKSAEEGGDCTLFGCATGLTKVSNDGHIQHVDNPHPTFFDISSVFRNADRIAFGTPAQYMSKAASAGQVIGGAEMAEIYHVTATLPVLLDSITNPQALQQVKLAYQLASIEDQIEQSNTDSRRQAMARALDPRQQSPMDLSPLGKVGSVRLATGLRALADQAIVLPVRDFVRLVVGDSAKCAALCEVVPEHLPGVYNRLIASSDLESSVCDNPFKPSRDLAPATQRHWAKAASAVYSLRDDAMRLRSSLSAIRNNSVPAERVTMSKISAESGEAETLARRYALYKLAFLANQSGNMPLTAECVVMQNYVS